ASIKLPAVIALNFDLPVDWRVLVFPLVVSLATCIVFSLLPALQSSRPDLVPVLKDEDSMGGFHRSRLRNALVVIQEALSLFSLVCAGLVVRSLQVAARMRPGFNPNNAVAISYDVGMQGYSLEKGRIFHKQVVERTQSLPGVRSVALVTTVPLTLDYSYDGIYVEGAQSNSADLPVAVPNWITPNYFHTMEIPLRG